MKKNIYKIILFIAFGIFLIGCENDITKSLYDEYPGENLPQPVVSNIAPANYALAGVDAIELTGENFSAVKENNLVYFGSARATVLEATSTRLTVRAPNNPAETLMVKVAVMGSDKYSENQQYKLLAAAQDYAVKTGRKAYAITVDKDENIYASATEADAGIGIIKIAPDGTVTNFAPKGGETFFNSIKLGPNGFIYGARAQKALFEIQPGVKSAPFVTIKAGSYNDFDWDKNNFMWAGGKDLDSLHRFAMDKTKKAFSFKGEVKSIKIAGNTLFAAVVRDAQEKIIKAEITDAGLGAEEEVYNLTAKYPNRTINSILVSTSGKVYIGTNSKTPEDDYGKLEGFPILIINEDKSESIMFEAMVPDKIFAGPIVAMAWGAGDYFYFTRAKLDKTGTDGTKSTVQNQEIVKVAARELSAPYYGRGDQ